MSMQIAHVFRYGIFPTVKVAPVGFIPPLGTSKK